MMKSIINNRNKNILFNLFFSWLFTLSALSGIMSITMLKGSFFATGLICLLFACLFSLVLLNEKTIIASVVFIIISIAFLYSRLSANEINPYWLSVYDYYVETKDFILGYIMFSELGNRITLWLLACLISFVSAFLIKMKYSYLFIFAIGTGLFIGVNSADLKGYDYAFLPMLFCLIMLYLKRANKTQAGSFAVVKFAPIIILVMAAAVFVPMPEKKLTQEQLEYAYEEVYWYFREPFMPKYFSPSNTGFEDENGRLGGSVNLADDFVMNVYADSPTYLYGSKRGIYTGYSWIYAEEEEFVPVESIDAFNEGMGPVMTLAGYYDLSDEFLESIGIEKKQLTIYLGKNRTGSIFTPNNPYDTWLYGDYSIKSNSEGDLRSEPVFKSNESYTIYYYDVDYSEYLFNELYGRLPERGFYNYAVDTLKASYEKYIFQDPISGIYYTPEELVALYESGYFEENPYYVLLIYMPESEIGENTTLSSAMRFLRRTVNSARAYENTFAPYAEYVYENYLNLPETLPQRVSDLAYEITKNQDSDYLKMKALERYLEKNFTYTLTPGEFAENADFVDEFLFESKKGYCTYFASAMAVMARTLGVPSRFAEGYITNSEKTEDSYYVVSSADAHAWTELYFEGIGWIPFDATPPEYVFTSAYAQEMGESGNYYFDGEDYSEEEETIYSEENLENISAEEMNNTASNQEESPHEKNSVNIFALALISFIFYVGLRFLYVKAKLKAIEKMPYDKAVMAYYKEMLDVLKFLGFHKKDYETAEGYAFRIKATIPVNYRILEGITKIYSHIRFGNAEIREKELVIARHAYYSFYNTACENDTKVRFFIHRYIKKIY